MTDLWELRKRVLRDRKTKQVNIRLSDSMYRRLRKLTEELGATQTEILRMAIVAFEDIVKEERR